MDVRFCENRNHRREAHRRAVNLVHDFLRAPPAARVRRRVFSLDNLNGRRRPLQGMKMGVVRQ
jgi:hypothetical protein